ncbi:MAG: acyl-CoA dehydrogenase family protein [Polyangiaceae bacterium]|nr:acyl-CoA dehydrogenase family protein [Polyangiaceae bacterium]
MFEWNEQQEMMRSVLRQWLATHLEPATPDLEEGRALPYELMRKLFQDFGMAELVAQSARKVMEKKRRGEAFRGGGEGEDPSRDPAIAALTTWELCRVNPGFCLSFGATLGLAGATLLQKGTPEQIERWALPVLTLEKIGCWGVTEPGAGSDAFSMQTLARRDGDGWVLSGSKIFITNAPYADVFVIYARIEGEGARDDRRNVHPFVLERGTPGLEVSKPMKKMGMRSSPTGEVFLNDVRVGRDQLLGGEPEGARDQVKDVFAGERTGSAPMCAGIIERCLDECLRYTVERRQWGKELARFQLVQDKIAGMYVAYNNVRNLVHQQIWQAKQGKATWKDACAAKLYATEAAVQVGMDAVQVLGGYGYLQDFPVERLTRDAKLLTIGGGTSQIQILNLARSLYAERGFSVSVA